MKSNMTKRFTHIRTGSGEHQCGSLTVEASLIFPMFFFFIMLFLRLFLLIMTETSVAASVCRLTTDMAPVSYVERALLKEKVTAPSLLCYPELLVAIGDNNQIENLRIICLDAEDEYVEVTVCYDFKLQVPGLPGFLFPVRQSFLIHTYIGEYDKDHLEKEETEEKQEVVFITENGSVYHLKKSCTYLYMPVTGCDISEVGSKRNSSGAKYYPCEKCSGTRQTQTVYITVYGTRYHYSSQCSALFRQVQEVSLDEVADRRPCSKCGQLD